MIVTRIALVALGLIVALVTAEVAVRLFRPDLAELTGEGFERDRYRIHANRRNHAHGSRHPDGRGKHLVIRNALGLRQHREIASAKRSGVVRIGVFDDSFTENLRVPAPYSFTEPLDYLLNRTGTAEYEVLNFGTDGYGTDQVYLQYVDEGAALDLDVVVYLFCHNDLRDVLADRLFDVDDRGRLVYLPVPQHGVLRDLLRRSALTYLVLEAIPAIERALARQPTRYDPATLVDLREEQRLRGEVPRRLGLDPDQKDPRLTKAWRIVRKLALRMKAETARRDQRFLIALTPLSPELNRWLAKRLGRRGIDVVDLAPLFETERVGLAPFLFRRDRHWNEEGNKLVAIHLFRALATRMGLEDPRDSFIRRSLFEYYSAFDLARLDGRWLESVSVSEEMRDDIRARYTGLEARYSSVGKRLEP